MNDETLTLEKLKIHERLASLETENAAYHVHSKEWRENLDEKVGKIFDRLDNLPCSVHEVKQEESVRMHNYIWMAIASIYIALGWIFKTIFNIKL